MARVVSMATFGNTTAAASVRLVAAADKCSLLVAGQETRLL